jgi:hypothetical protein
MSSPVQERADAANDSYANRSQSDVLQPTKVQLDGKWHQVFGYANDPISGFHAAPSHTHSLICSWQRRL